ncbi:MAG: matrixin family metalloprotease [Pseudomonadota bacterium]
MDFGEFKWGDAPFGGSGGTVTWSLAAISDEFNRFVAPITGRGFRKRVKEAFDAWEDVVDIEFRQVRGDREADIQIGYGAFDGRLGTLGRAEVSFDDALITGAVIRMDIDEDWTFKRDFVSRSRDDPQSFYATIAHEIGHAIGLDHLDPPKALLHPFAGTTIDLTLKDVRAAVALYGPREGRGRDGSQILAGDAEGDTLSGGAGHDDLHGFAGDDLLFGGDARDALHGGSGRDALSGGSGRDLLMGGAGRDLLAGGAGRDRLQGDRGADGFLLEFDGGRDRVLDFDAARDRIVAPQDVAVFVRVKGEDLVVALGGGDALHLRGAAELDRDDLLFG